MNINLLDKNDKKIEKGMNVRIHQRENTILIEQEFKDQEEADGFARLSKTIYKDDRTYEYRKEETGKYQLYADGVAIGMTVSELILERQAFYMNSENTIKEMGIEIGDSVLVFGFEGSAVGVCRYPSDMLEIIN